MTGHVSDILILIVFGSIGLLLWYSFKKQDTGKDLTIDLNKLSKRQRRDNQEEE
jgi:hypothetical protein